MAGEFLEKFEKYQETRTSLENANSKSFEEYGGYGGNPAKVFKAFGYEDAKEILSDSDDFDKLLKDILDNPDKYMATAASRQTKEQLRRIYNDPNNELYEYYHMNQDEYAKLLNEAPLEKDLNGIVGNHSFGFEVARNSNGEIVIKVTNPWATSDKYKVLTLTPDEFKTYFDKIQFVKID